MKWRETPTDDMGRNTNRWNGEKHRQIKWRATPTDEMESNTDRWNGEHPSPFHLLVLLSISSVGVPLHFIRRCCSPFHLSVLLSISSVGVSLHFICWCFSPFYLSVFLSISDSWNGEQHRQMKWRETLTDKMERNTDRWNGEKHRHLDTVSTFYRL
jgi:hypothetical protein